MIKPIEMYKIICDGCVADAFADDDYSCWNEKSIAREMAEEGGWQEIDDKDYCPNCYEFDEESDEYVVTAAGARSL